MKTTKGILSVILGLAFITMLFSFKMLFSFAEPKGWYKAGSMPKSYDMGVDKASGQDGKNAATIKSIETNISGFGTLMQNCLPDSFLGKRVRMSGMMRSKDVSDWAGFWFRVDPKGGQGSLAFDNMHDGKSDRSIKGTTAWTAYEIVLDVPLQASNLAYGALISGTGQIWFDDIKFEVVDNKVPTTGGAMENVVPNAPVNLDFEN
ncbi:MAG TPA: hypothetical protein VFV79_09780 [Saprospiraceae bacterium]|nr:hypothetical protein [Saprospiraceae bacterium]